jgi:hypothetical protein
VGWFWLYLFAFVEAADQAREAHKRVGFVDLSSLRGATRQSNPFVGAILDCCTSLAMTPRMLRT